MDNLQEVNSKLGAGLTQLELDCEKAASQFLLTNHQKGYDLLQTAVRKMRATVGSANTTLHLVESELRSLKVENSSLSQSLTSLGCDDEHFPDQTTTTSTPKAEDHEETGGGKDNEGLDHLSESIYPVLPAIVRLTLTFPEACFPQLQITTCSYRCLKM